MNAFSDRQYQTEAVHNIWTYFESHDTGNPILAMPTGSGKTIVNARFLKEVYTRYPYQRIMLLTHVKEWIQQNYEKLLLLWPDAPVGIYSDGLGRKQSTFPLTFGGIASVWRNPKLFGHIDLVIVDEVHLVSPRGTTMYQTFIQKLKEVNPHIRVVGLTATPWRMGHGKLTDPYLERNGKLTPSIFTDFCFDITNFENFNRLIAEGYLLPLIPKKPKLELNVDGVHLRGGEFIEKDLQVAVDKYEITLAALKEAIELGKDRKKWLVFGAGIEHAEHITAILNDLGINAGCVHSKREDRNKTIADFRAGRIRALVNNNILTTGFDDADIDMIIVLRPTMSTVLWVQMLGRGTRPLFPKGYPTDTMEERFAAIAASGKKDCLVLDYAGNTRRLGPINDPVIPTPPRARASRPAPVKICDNCSTYVHASARICPCCGNEFKIDINIFTTASSISPLKGEMPITKVFKVDHISAARHEKVSANSVSLRVSYYCKLKMFTEFVTFENSNAYAQRRARAWWKARMKYKTDEIPTTVADALARLDQLNHPTHIRVWVNKNPFPEIMALCFDGTAFGTEEMSDEVPSIVTDHPIITKKHQEDMDIPF
jgi:DNA repair protein RadD